MAAHDDTATPDRVQETDDRERRRREFAEDFGLYWEQAGSPRMDGRILGYLMIMKEPYISSAELAKVLNASAGSVSMSTRRMVDAGFIKRHVVPGDRNHYFRADDDPWGSFLAGERRYLDRQRELIEHGFDIAGDDETDVRRRLRNGSDYMTWLAQYHRKMLGEWEAYKAERGLGDD
ncbi:GbsR/MarR family transcriptional regulator [Agromyces albus]|uniref:Winged helix-turn-helix transcriptional regulator n=1 Tax=Agromyces albus TaxID=205332 RepID=A0A4Q2KZH2_9MICO|nr:MarR family transcriptional regulator [Agromyces albus]RXZ70437.1 winged helix-turn-helix transcriptional regulator [Agromyces albus]